MCVNKLDIYWSKKLHFGTTAAVSRSRTAKFKNRKLNTGAVACNLQYHNNFSFKCLEILIVFYVCADTSRCIGGEQTRISTQFADQKTCWFISLLRNSGMRQLFLGKRLVPVSGGAQDRPEWDQLFRTILCKTDGTIRTGPKILPRTPFFSSSMGRISFRFVFPLSVLHQHYQRLYRK